MENKEILEIVRKLLKPEDVISETHKASTIRSVMFGQRKNEALLHKCVKQSLIEIETMKMKLVHYLSTIEYTNNRQLELTDFCRLDENKQFEFLKKLDVKELHNLKKDLIANGMFYSLNINVAKFMEKPSRNAIKLLRYAQGLKNKDKK